MLSSANEAHRGRPRVREALLALAVIALSVGSCGEASVGAGVVADGKQLATLGEPGRARDYDVLLVTLDTVRADRLGCYGYDQDTTPNLDGLARTGIRFTDVTASAPITLPSHATIMTGLAVPSHGVRNNGAYRLSRDHVTLAERCSEAGYDTGAFVGSFVLDGRYGLDQGFMRYDDDTNPEGEQGASGRHHERSAAAVTDAALAWLAERPADARLFTWVHYFDAHRPYEAPARYQQQHPGRDYDAEIAYADAQLGRLIEALRQSGRLDRTLVVVASDHGEGLGEHGEQTHSLLIYESTMHVPLVLSCPTLFDGEWVVDDRVGGLVDLAPTLLSLLGLPAIEAGDGRPLLEPAADPGRAIAIESMVPALTHGWAPLTGLRRHADKYIEAPVPEYYRLDTDPREQHNRWEGSPGADGLVDELAARAERWGDVDEVEPAMDPEVVEKLAALGYVRTSYRPQGERSNPADMVAVWDAISQAEMHSLRGEDDRALAIIEKVVQQDPEDGRAWYTLALIHRRAGHFDRAEAALLRSTSFVPSADAYVLLAQLQATRGAYAEFDLTIEAARALEPDNGQIEIAVGDRLAVEGRFAEALAAFERALMLDPVRAGPLAREKIGLARARLGDR